MNAKSLISILLASLILVYVGHSIIPHHHHLDDVATHEGCAQHDSDDQQGYSDKPSNHCHAFNGLEYFSGFEKFSVRLSTQAVNRNLLGVIPLIDEPLLSVFSETRNRGSSFECCGHLGRYSGLRAPPLSV